jgi:hypothetical protein
VQAVLGILDNFATEGSSAFSVMSAAVGSSNTIEVLTRRFQQVRGGGGVRLGAVALVPSIELEHPAHWQHFTTQH